MPVSRLVYVQNLHVLVQPGILGQMHPLNVWPSPFFLLKNMVLFNLKVPYVFYIVNIIVVQ